MHLYAIAPIFAGRCAEVKRESHEQGKPGFAQILLNQSLRAQIVNQKRAKRHWGVIGREEVLGVDKDASRIQLRCRVDLWQESPC